MNILIVDDEKLALARLKRLLNDEGLTQIVECDNPIEAIKEASKNRFDVAFLDISMPNINGLDLASTILDLNPEIFIIFQTAYEEYALEAFKNGGMDYLLKPISNESVHNALEKVKKYSNTKEKSTKKIMAKRGSKIYLIDIDDIYYIKADLDEIIIRIKETDAYVRKKIGDMQSLLESKNFFRIHRSYIINIDKIKSMQSVEQSKLQISFIGIDDLVTSSKDGAKEFREYLEKRTL